MPGPLEEQRNGATRQGQRIMATRLPELLLEAGGAAGQGADALARQGGLYLSVNGHPVGPAAPAAPSVPVGSQSNHR